MPRRVAVVLAAFCIATVGFAAEKAKPKKPSLELRASPRFAFSPANVLFTAELKGGDEAEEFYCPEIEWDWDDGGKSAHAADCDPWTGESKLQRRFSERHDYPHAGLYNARITLKKAGKTFVSQTVEVTVRQGIGDTNR